LNFEIYLSPRSERFYKPNLCLLAVSAIDSVVQRNLQKLKILPECRRDPKTLDVSEGIFSYKLHL